MPWVSVPGRKSKPSKFDSASAYEKIDPRQKNASFRVRANRDADWLLLLLDSYSKFTHGELLYRSAPNIGAVCKRINTSGLAVLTADP